MMVVRSASHQDDPTYQPPEMLQMGIPYLL